MTDWKYTKRSLMKAGYKIAKSNGHGKVLLKKENSTVLLWIDEADADTYWYLFFADGRNTSFHKKGLTVWEETAHGEYEVDEINYFDKPEHVLERGKHFGHHVNLEQIINIVFAEKEEAA